MKAFPPRRHSLCIIWKWAFKFGLLKVYYLIQNLIPSYLIFLFLVIFSATPIAYRGVQGFLGVESEL